MPISVIVFNMEDEETKKSNRYHPTVECVTFKRRNSSPDFEFFNVVLVPPVNLLSTTIYFSCYL
uniref:Uncharacterized protein n=1 Tax=Daphnia magna TaxID=35525 RepID=A0A0P6AHS0_9CRUS